MLIGVWGVLMVCSISDVFMGVLHYDLQVLDIMDRYSHHLLRVGLGGGWRTWEKTMGIFKGLLFYNRV